MPGTNSGPAEVSDGNELDGLARERLPDEEAQTGVESALSFQRSTHPENGNDDSNSSSAIDQDEVDRLWNDLKAETGFTSYLDFLDRASPDESFLRSLDAKEALKRIIKDTAGSDQSKCAIVDVQDKDYKLSLRCNSSLATEILSALRQPPATTRISIVLWDTTSLTEEMLNALGLGLRIAAPFFDALVSRHPKALLPSEGCMGGTISDDVVVIGQYVMTLVHDHTPAAPDAAPIVLIAAVNQGVSVYDQNFLEISPVRRPGMHRTNSIPSSSLMLLRWVKEYLRGLNFELKRGSAHGGSTTDLTFDPLVTLLKFSMLLIRPECKAARANYLNATKPRRIEGVGGTLKDVFENRYMLRRMIEDSEDNSLRLRDYIHSLEKDDISRGHSLMALEVDLQQTRLEAARLEIEIRDYLQLQTSESALQESKKSIELSNFQIEEAKRVKIVTILAFVYVPLNLATSIFGMNIEQLNGSGQRLSVFITTAVVTLAVTGGSWFVIEQVNSYRKWRKRSRDALYDGKTQFALAVRLAMLVFLISDGHSKWMWKSGAWWRILINDRSLLTGSFGAMIDDGSFTACEYVSKHSIRRSDQHWYFDEDDPIKWVKVKKDDKDD